MLEEDQSLSRTNSFQQRFLLQSQVEVAMLRCILPSVHGPGSVPKLGASGSWNLRLKLSKILEIHIIHTYPYCPQGVNQILQGLSYYCICPFLSCNRSEYRQLLLRSVEVTPGLRTIHPPRAMLLWRSFSGLCMFFSFNYVSTMFQGCGGVEMERSLGQEHNHCFGSAGFGKWLSWLSSASKMGRPFNTFEHFRTKLCGKLRRGCGDERSLLSRHGRWMETGGRVGSCPLAEERRNTLYLQNV